MQKITRWCGVYIVLLAISATAQTNTFPASGNVGIGTTTPNQTLVVSGNIAATTGGGGGGVYLRSGAGPNANTVVDPKLLFEGMTSGDGSAATPWGLNLGSIPWTWGGDQMTYHAGLHVFRTLAGNAAEVDTMSINSGSVNIKGQLQINGNIALLNGSPLIFSDGTVQSTAWNGVLSGGDYAESVNISGDRKAYEPGDVLVLSDTDGADIAKSSEPYSRLVAGISSTKPGLVGRRQPGSKTDSEIPIAMVGIVPTKVNDEGGAIKRGDLLVTSSTAGYP